MSEPHPNVLTSLTALDAFNRNDLAGQTSELERVRLQLRVWEPADRRLLWGISEDPGALIDVDAVAALLGAFNGVAQRALLDDDFDPGSTHQALADAHVGLPRTHAAPSVGAR